MSYANSSRSHSFMLRRARLHTARCPARAATARAPWLGAARARPAARKSSLGKERQACMRLLVRPPRKPSLAQRTSHAAAVFEMMLLAREKDMVYILFISLHLPVTKIILYYVVSPAVMECKQLTSSNNRSYYLARSTSVLT